MKMKKVLLLASSLLLLTACSTTKEQCDPSLPQSFLNKIACTTSGHYDQRISDKEQELAKAKERNKQLKREHQKAKDKAQTTATVLADKEAQVAKLNQETQSYLSQLKDKAQGKQNVLDEIAKIEKQLNQVSGSEQQQKEKIKALQRKLKALEKATGI